MLHARVLDPLLLALLVALYAIEVRPLPGASPLVLGPYAALDALAGLLFAIALLVLPARWRAPWPAAGLALSAAYAFRALEYPPVAALDLAVLVALFGLGDRSDPPAVIVVALWVLAVQVVAPEPLEVAPLAIQLVVFEGAWVLGRSGRAQRRHAALLAERAQLLERARIARELHDVIGHHITVAVVQAEAAEAALDGASPRALAAVRAVQDAARRALAEARQVMGVWRSGEPESAPLAPAPSLSRLREFVEGARAAGLDVALAVEGDLDALSPAADRAAYRVVQEALTNALRHAPDSAVRVDVSRGVDALTIDVTNGATAVTVPTAPAGQGLEGLRERVVALGGSVEAAPGLAGGFRLHAVLPAQTVEV
jgi:signal transduction histidine kinase